MSKTPVTGVFLSLLIGLSGPSGASGAVGDPAHPIGGFDEASSTADGATPADGVPRSDGERPAMDFNQTGSKAADLPLDAVSGQATAPLPLSQVAGGPATGSGPVRLSLWDMFNQIRYGGLPEPASWALMLIGFGMIGGALRGFMIANRRLAGLQPEEAEDGEAAEAAEDRP